MMEKPPEFNEYPNDIEEILVRVEDELLRQYHDKHPLLGATKPHLHSNHSLLTATESYLHSNDSNYGGNQSDYYYYYDYDYDYGLNDRARSILLKPYAIITIILAFLAISSNVLSLLALTQVRTTIGSYFKLLMSLAISDIIVGLSLLLLFLSKVFNPALPVGVGPYNLRLRHRCTFMVIKALNNTALNSTTLNLMVMAFDHYIAILKPLHYHMFINNRRRYIVITGLWIIAALCGFSTFFSGIGTYSAAKSELNYCEHIWINPYHEEYITLALGLICLAVMSFIYIRICCVVQAQQSRDSTYHTSDLKKNKKALVTTLLILGAFMLCWLPISLLQLSLMIQVKVNPSVVQKQIYMYYKIEMYMQALFFLNAICDPIIYASRMREVRHGYYYLFWFCCRCLRKGGMLRRYSMGSHTQDSTFASSMRRMSTVSQRRSSIMTSFDSPNFPKSGSFHSTHSVPVLDTVRETDTANVGLLANGNANQANGKLVENNNKVPKSESILSAILKNGGGFGKKQNGALLSDNKEELNNGDLQNGTIHHTTAPLIPKQNSNHNGNGHRVHYDDDVMVNGVKKGQEVTKI